MLKNTFKLSLHNFSMVWRILLYKIINLIFVIGLTTVVCLPIIRQLINQNFFGFFHSNISAMALNFNLNAMIDTFIAIGTEFFAIINSAGLLTLFIVSASVATVVYYFIDRLSYLAIIDNLRSFMSNNLKLGFMNSYISNFGKSLKLSLFKVLTTLPIDLGIIASAVAIYFALNNVSLILAPTITTIYALIVCTLKTTLFVSVESAMAVNDCNIFTALKINFNIISKKFFSLLGNSLFIAVFVLFLNMFAIFFTFGVTLALTIPLSVLFVLVFRNIVFYEYSGMRYYTDANNIVIPKKLEEQDAFNRVKNII